MAGLQSKLRRHTFPKGIQNHIKNEAKQTEAPAQGYEADPQVIGCRLWFSPSFNMKKLSPEEVKMCLRIGEGSLVHLRNLNLKGKFWHRWEREFLDIGP